MDLLVTLERLGRALAGALPHLGEADGQVGDGVLEGAGEVGEMRLVRTDQSGVVLGGEAVGQGEGGGGEGRHEG